MTLLVLPDGYSLYSLLSSLSFSPSALRLPEVAVPGGALGERVVVVGGELGAALQPLRGDDGGDGAEAGVVEGAEVAVGREGVVHLVAQGGWKTEIAQVANLNKII